MRLRSTWLDGAARAVLYSGRGARELWTTGVIPSAGRVGVFTGCGDGPGGRVARGVWGVRDDGAGRTLADGGTADSGRPRATWGGGGVLRVLMGCEDSEPTTG